MNLKIVNKKRSDLVKQDLFLPLQKLILDNFKNSEEKAIRISRTRPFFLLLRKFIMYEFENS